MTIVKLDPLLRRNLYFVQMLRFFATAVAMVVGLSGVHAGESVIRLVEFDDVAVTSATANRIIRAIDDADERGDDLVLIELDTPGGLVAAMEDIVKRMLSAKTPIVVWVGPSGAKAASAGFFILVAADLAAMAPGTRCGAASVVYGAGKSEEGDVSLKKANKDLAALIRSIAEHRGRNVEVVEKAVFAADAWTDAVALEEGIVDVVARNREDLLEQIHSMEIQRFDGTTVTLQTADPEFVVSESNFRHKVFEFLANPAVAYLLLMIGIGGLYVEMSHPGLVFPAVIGILCLILFAFTAQVLPISTIGVLLMLLAIVMFILEIKVTSFGMLTLGGAVCLVIGSMMLFEGPIPELRVPVWLYLPTALALTAVCALALQLAIRAQRARVATGVEGLAGEFGTVTEELSPHGKVFVHGELWDATSAGGTVTKGSRVRVVKAEELRLTVEPADNQRPGGG